MNIWIKCFEKQEENIWIRMFYWLQRILSGKLSGNSD